MADNLIDSNQKSPRILIAEDNPANQAVLLMQLGTLGLSADFAADGAEARLKWLSGGYDLILTDLNMPGMDGLELTRTIRGCELATHGGHAIIIGFTAEHGFESLHKCLQAGMDDVLFKPIELRQLADMLDRWARPSTGAPRIARRARQPPDACKAAEVTLDQSVLCRIIGNTDTAKSRELLDLFILTVRQDLPDCRRHLSGQNASELSMAMHKLKTSARALGASCFADMAEAIEAEANAKRMVEAAVLFAALESELPKLEIAAARLGFDQVQPPDPNTEENSGLSARWLDARIDELSWAIQNQAVEIHFQPVIDLVSLVVTSIESSAVWRRNNAPISVIDIAVLARRHGLIEPVCELLAAKSMISATRLAAAGCNLPISVTLSAHAGSNKLLTQLLLATAAAIGFDPANLILDIPEALLIENFSAAAELAAYLNPTAVKFSINNFGSKGLALRKLGHLPIHRIKIERDLIQQSADHSAGMNSLLSTIETAKQMQIVSVAQGLETQRELDRARELGFDRAQGTAVAALMPLEKLLILLEERRNLSQGPQRCENDLTAMPPDSIP